MNGQRHAVGDAAEWRERLDNSVQTLRPLSLGDLLDRTLALYRQNFALFAGLVAVLAVPQAIITTLINVSRPNGIGSGVGLLGLSVVVSIVFSALITGALAQAISARYLGRQITVAEAYTSIGLGTFVTLAVASLLLGALIVLGLVTLGILSVFFFVRYLFVSQAIVLEREPLGAAFGRSWQLTRGSFWRVFGYAIVVYLIAIIFEAIVGGIPGAIFAIGGGKVVFSSLFSAIATVLIEPFQLGALTLLYYDLRVRKEGFDLEHLARGLNR